jgi:pimeloyl-ACP methyl ester carboxylesterase
MEISEPTTETISIFGSDTAYWIYHSEQTKTIFMIHGFRGNHRGLQYVIAGLPEYRIVVPDLPGFGLSTPMTSQTHNIDGYAAFAKEFILRIGVARPVLLGHSFGTIVAAHLAVWHPDLFAELIMINPISVSPRRGVATRATTSLVEAYYWLGSNLPPSWSQRVLKSRGFNRLMSLTLIRTREPKLRRLVYAHHLSDLDYPQHQLPIAQAFADSITKTALDDATRINQRTLLIAGGNDPIVPAKSQTQLHVAIKGSVLIMIPKVGHLIHLETPAAASDAIKKFLS